MHYRSFLLENSTYGGDCFIIHDTTIMFVNLTRQNLHRQCVISPQHKKTSKSSPWDSQQSKNVRNDTTDTSPGNQIKHSIRCSKSVTRIITPERPRIQRNGERRGVRLLEVWMLLRSQRRLRFLVLRYCIMGRNLLVLRLGCRTFLGFLWDRSELG